ncbi:MAG: TonB-dependent receptor, partial [Chitinophagales bacterium]|nr:TonB-dependent receptor [Chitinophagales bacterium]
VLMLLIIINSFAQNILSGKVTDAKDGSPLIGATVSIPEIKTGTVTNENGKFNINNLPDGNFLIRISYIGYSTTAQRVDVNGATIINFSLSNSAIEQNEVIVTGVSTATEIKRTPTPISVISKEELWQTPSTNIIDAIAKQPGISQVTTGPGISKPEIRGLGYNRVVVLDNGIRQEGQQWGDEHGIEIDEYAANKVEILKGPGSIMYGSDAMAGVINILSADPVAEGKIHADLFTNYQTNNSLIGYSADVMGNEKGFVWLGRFSGKRAHSYQNPYDGYVFNSGFKERAGSGYIGLNKAWGYSHLNFSIYSFKPGLAEGSRDSTGAFIKAVAVNDSTAETVEATADDLNSYNLFIPNQNIKHFKVSLMNNFYIGNSKLYVNVGYENNQRQEFGDIFNPDQYGLYFFLNTIPYDVRWTIPESHGWHVTLGLNGMYQQHENKGIEYLVPSYHLLDGGIFLFAQKTIKKLTLSGGLRFDNRNITTQNLFLNEAGMQVSTPDSFSILKFTGTSLKLNAVSGSAGLSYEISKQWILKANVARGFRAPNIAELGANGRHEGTFRYEIGNPDLIAESSLQFDAGLGFNTEHVSGELNLFDNHISNFIFPEKLLSILGGDSVNMDEADGSSVPVYKYVQGTANLYGCEFSIDIHPHPFDWLHFKSSFSYVKSVQKNQPDSTRYLPFTPPARIQSELRGNFKRINSSFRNFYVVFGLVYNFAQNNVYSAYGTETPSPAYMLLNASAGTDVYMKDHVLFTLSLIVNNLADNAYQDHLSRLRYAPENIATGRVGIYNMGRNFSIKLNIPFDIKK